MPSSDYEIYRPTTRPRPEPPLPSTSPGAAERPQRRHHHGGQSGWCGRGGSSNWLAISCICIAIWAVTGLGYFWPMWVMLGVGIPALLRRR